MDALGNIYVTGATQSADFPTTANALQPDLRGVYGNVFVSKFSPDGATLLYSTYLGGTGGDSGWGIAVDALGNAYVTGGTSSTDFPTTPNALQPTSPGYEHAFVSKLSPDGATLLYSTYLGGTGFDVGWGIAVAAATGKAYVTGYTDSTDFPTTANALQPIPHGTYDYDAFVTVLSTVARPPGDINGDGQVDCADLNIVRASLGKRAGETGFDPRADINQDGIVDVQDLAVVAQQLPAGAQCP